MRQTIFAIGDIHGQADNLERLLDRLERHDGSARFVFLGDYIDRGPDTRRVVDRLLALGQARPDSVFLMGNHEAALMRLERTRSPEELRFLRAIGFQATLDSYAAPAGTTGLDVMPPEHQAFFRGLEPIRRIGPYVFFHAPLPADASPETADPLTLDGLLGNRTINASGWAQSGRTLVFGHMPLASPLVAPGLIGIDTGAGRGGLLTAVELPAGRFHHA